MSEHEFFTVAEVAARWRCSTDTVSRRIADGSLKAVKGAGGWRIHHSAVEAFESAGVVNPPRRKANASRRATVPDVLGVLK